MQVKINITDGGIDLTHMPVLITVVEMAPWHQDHVPIAERILELLRQSY
jgi:hypothetical protein